MPSTIRPETLVAAIRMYGVSDKPWLIIPRDPISSDEATSHSFREVFEAAGRVAAGLRRDRQNRPVPICIIADNGLQFVVSLLGCWLAGTVPVPLPTPFTRPDWHGYLERIAQIHGETRSPAVLVSDELVAVRDGLAVLGVPAQTYSQVGANESVDVATAVTPAPDDLALIQYSSGSTRVPLGAALTHRNLVANVEGIGQAVNAIEDDVALCWLPLFHDMGLTGTLLYSLYWGMSLVLMTPLQFIMKPASWLWAITRFKATGCASPNFGYALCASESRVPDSSLQGIDLGSWRVAFNGAEAIQERTVESFSRRFSRYGFRPEAMFPVYGLAENTVAACAPKYGVLPRSDRFERESLERHTVTRAARPNDHRSRVLFSVGTPLAGQEIRIIRDDGGVAVDREVGEIQVRGGCVMREYYGRPVETRVVLDEEGWLRTGDLGYVADGELYVVGRIKEVIKKAGSKYDAADIQSVASSVAGVRAGCVAAFSVPDQAMGTEALVLVVEPRNEDPDELARLERTIQTKIHGVFGIRPNIVRFIRPGTLPKSSSGKVQTFEARSLFECHALQELRG